MAHATVGFTLDTLLRKKIEKLRRKEKDVRRHNRLSALLWLGQGRPLEQVAELLGVGFLVAKASQAVEDHRMLTYVERHGRPPPAGERHPRRLEAGAPYTRDRGGGSGEEFPGAEAAAV